MNFFILHISNMHICYFQDFLPLGLVVGLCWKMNTEKKNNQRHHPVYKFPTPALENLLLMANKSPLENVVTFTRDYGRILTWLKYPLTDYQKDGLHAHFQFYDRELRCFVFPDYLLIPTLESIPVSWTFQSCIKYLFMLPWRDLLMIKSPKLFI